ncbi:MAG: 1-acyl-sn-glycerol-3-phosphate acyltransferase [Betaproteobacteria bacterium]|nr:1-acyl-sn-glycerol-3-phosphate acyltransferase [Betaproteobacteria bacterium]
MNALRSVVFALAIAAFTPPFALLVLACFFLPRLRRNSFISIWARFVLLLARVLYGIRFKVEGAEHLPKSASVVLANHQSAWETFAFQVIFPPQSYVLKRELLWIPFFGWALALMSPIAIDRGRGSAALRQVARKGARRLAQGLWVIVFPEGTRYPPGRHGRWRLGGAWLAAASGAPVVPVAHNAGLLWPNGRFPQRAGVITVRIGAPIASAEREPQAINDEAHAWVEAQNQALSRGH